MSRMKPLEDQSKIDLEQEEANETSNPSTHSNGDVPPPRSAEFNRETCDRDQAGYWYPSKTKTVMMNWEMLNPQMRRDNKNINLQLK